MTCHYFLLNQNADLEAFSTLAKKHVEPDDTIHIISSHGLFEHEAGMLNKLQNTLSISTMADFLSDDMQAWVDRQTAASLAGLHQNQEIQASFPEVQANTAMRLKNQLLHKTLEAKQKAGVANRYYFMDGLGFHAPFWRSVGAQEMQISVQYTDPPFGTKGNTGHLVQGPAGDVWIFITSVKRLSFSQQAKIVPFDLPAGLETYSRDQFRRFASELVQKMYGGTFPWKLVSTIHEFRSWMTALDPSVSVVLDGFHPPNYERAYIDYYPRSATIYSNDPVSVHWFRQHGYRVRPDRRLKTTRMQPSGLDPSSVSTIVFPLNHAGDWSALINRSDTDRLAEASVALAMALPEKEIILRSHPTMAFSSHEGIGSGLRLKKLVGQAALPNLIYSEATLEEDFERGDLFISEYSQVLIDAWRRGKLGAVLNLTGRRSYFQIFDQLGFPDFSSVPSLASWVKGISGNSAQCLLRHNYAVANYNRRVEEHEA